jgi:ABC-type glutathione transport system ATPase component
MLCDEINSGVVHKLDREPGNDTAIKVKNGNFFWGLEKKSSQETQKIEEEIEEEKKEPLIKKEVRKSEGTVGQLLSLRDINIEIKHGEFVCIIGDVGSGKSSLLSAMIGDMLYLESDFLQKNSSRNLEDLVSSKIM